MNTLALCCVLSSVLYGAPAGNAGSRVALEIDVSALPDDDITKSLKLRMEEKQTQVIQDAGLTVAAEADQTMQVVVARYGDNGIHSRATVLLVDADGNAKTERVVECELCRDGDLVMQVAAEVKLLAHDALYATNDPVVADTEEDEDNRPEPVAPSRVAVRDDTDDVSHAPNPRVGAMGYSGIGMLAGGVVGLSSGVPLTLRKNETRRMPGETEIRTTRPAGVTLSVVGGVLAATGAALLIYDMRKRKRQPHLSLGSGSSPLGFSVGGKF